MAVENENRTRIEGPVPAGIEHIVADSFPGFIVVINENGIVLHVHNMGKHSREWVGYPIRKWIDNDFISTSPSLSALRSGRTEIDYVAKKKHPVATVAVPIKDETSAVRYVVAYSLPKDMIRDITEMISKEQEIVHYLSSYREKQTSLVTKDTRMKQILEDLKMIAKTDATVMLTGETGVGKEVFSRFIHSSSRRSSSVFVPVNCSAIPEELIESEFFGYESGAFTGAKKGGKIGLFEMANGGTLFLDEIGELPLSIQPKLLRVLDSGEYRRVGGNKTFSTNVRIICATNRDLYQMVKEGTFREDLFYRLNVIPLRIPALRERKDDIVPMAEFFLQRLNRKYATSKKFSQETMDYFLTYKWPGNIRELSNAVEQLYVTAMSDMLEQNTGSRKIERMRTFSSDEGRPEQEPRTQRDRFAEIDYEIPLKDVVRQYEEQYVRRVIDSCGGRISLAARKMHITKAGLYKKLEGYRSANKESEAVR